MIGRTWIQAGLGTMLAVCLWFSAAAAQDLLVAVDPGYWTIVEPRAWVDGEDVVVSWGMHNFTRRWLEASDFSLELHDKDGRVVARTAGRNLLSTIPAAPGERRAEHGILQGAAAEAGQVWIRLHSEVSAARRAHPALDWVITAAEPYLDGMYKLYGRLTNRSRHSVAFETLQPQIIMVKPGEGVVGTRPLSMHSALEPSEGRDVEVVTGPVYPGWLPKQISSMETFATGGVNLQWDLEP